MKLQILNPDQDCVLYEENQTIDTQATNGYFNIQVGTATGHTKRTTGDSGHTMGEIYSNLAPSISGKTLASGAACTYTPSAGDARYLRVSLLGSDGTPHDLSPNMAMNSVPSAMVAETTETLQGKTPTDFLNLGTITNLTQPNVENIFSATNYPRLTSLLSVPAANYVQVGGNTTIGVPQVAGNPALGSLTSGQMWYDSGSNSLKFYNGTAVQTLGISGAGITSLIAGAGLNGGTITTGGQTISVDVGTAAGQIVQVQPGGKLPALDGSNLTNLTIANVAGNMAGDVTGTLGATVVSQVGGSTAANVHTAELLANAATNNNTLNALVKRDGSGNFAAGTITANLTGNVTGNVTGAASLNVLKAGDTLSGNLTYAANIGNIFTAGSGANTVSVQGPTGAIGSSYVLRLPDSQSTGSQALMNDGSGNLSWQSLPSGTVTGVTGNAPISVSGTTAPIISVSAATTGASGVVTLATDGGTTASTVVQATDSRLTNSRAPNGSASGDLSGTYPGPTVAKIQGQSVSATAPTASGQVLRYDGSSAYAPSFLSLADIRSTVTPTNTMFPASTCTAAQTLTWSALTDTMSCTTIAIPNTQVSGLGALATKSAATLSSSDVTGTLPVANGGTGQTSFVDGQLLIGNSTGNTLTKATLTAGTGVKITNGSGSVTIAADSNQPSEYDPSCPAGYVSVPGNPTYGGSGFCVMKYEAKTGSNVVAATTAAAGNPVVSINRDNARTSCRLIGPGYDLISNAQWQTIARNIARTASNWSTGTVASGELNRGHSDNDPAYSLAADASDVNACLGTNQTCPDTVWDSQRRTHTLSNGEVIWDFAGNVWEWVTDNNSAIAGADGYVSTFPTNDKRQRRYGADPATLCATPNASPYCGMGHAWANYSAGAVHRGGYWGYGFYTGVFASHLFSSAAAAGTLIGFRCVYQP